MKMLKGVFVFYLFISFAVYSQKSLHDFKVDDIEGKSFDFSSLKGKKVIVVNTASECGLTGQYAQLEEINKKYGDKLTIVGFPSNNFGSQEPGSNEEIASFCEKNYGVTFPMMAKVSVKGEDQCEIYKFLTQKDLNGLVDSEVKWNFQKYLINEAGMLERVVGPRELPNSTEIVEWIEN